MKKLTALVLVLVMCFGLVACGSTPAPVSYTHLMGFSKVRRPWGSTWVHSGSSRLP